VKRTYLDHNATSPMSVRVLDILWTSLDRLRGNASSPHAEGQEARLALERAREKLAALIGISPREVIFTSGGSEANNAALRGAAAALIREGAPRHIVTSSVEHPSILETARSLQYEGMNRSHLPVDDLGQIDPESLRRLLEREPACLVSVMHANNETGVIHPVAELARVAHEAGALFHCDFVQSAGRIPLEEAIAEVDLGVLTSHKVGGPVGVGALLLKERVKFVPEVTGGAQEARKRAGTEPVALAVAFVEALDLATSERSESAARLESLRDFIEEAVGAIAPEAVFHGRGASRLPNTTNVFFPGAAGRNLVMQLDLMGYAVSTGSACSTGSSRPSHVLEAMGCSPLEALESLRISLGPETRRDDITGFLSALSHTLDRSASLVRAHLPEGAAR
jgi:cysteine desulfurase